MTSEDARVVVYPNTVELKAQYSNSVENSAGESLLWMNLSEELILLFSATPFRLRIDTVIESLHAVVFQMERSFKSV
jgi:hypothetical protein